MDNEYVKRALDVRKKVTKLTVSQQREILRLYEGVIEDLARDIGKSKSKSLNERWLLERHKAFKIARKQLAKDIEIQVKKSLYKASELGTEVNRQMMMDLFQVVGIDAGNHWSTAFSQIQDKVVKDIIGGDLYRDHSTLSKRIWNFTDKSGKDLQYLLQKGILEGKSALELARDVEEFVKDSAKRPWEWPKVYPKLANTKIDYNAQRLSRTMINHSYQTASIKSSEMNPFVEGIEWRSAMINHRTCKLCISRHGQIFPKDDVPLDHPNGLCTMLPHIAKSLDEVATELRDWLDNGNNATLDKWYQEYGDYFAFKEL